MNSFSHVLAFLDAPYFAVGTCVPDLLTACDRQCRARKKKAVNWIDDDNPIVRAVAGGVVRHHKDDYWFHGSAAFRRLNMQLAVEYRENFGSSQSMQASLIGHIVIEMLLDAWLETQFPGSIESMYQQLAKVETTKVQQAINRFASRPTDKLAGAIDQFLRVRYVFDYLQDQGVQYRMNRVLERLTLKPMPSESVDWIGTQRRLVYDQAPLLLKHHAKLLAAQ